MNNILYEHLLLLFLYVIINCRFFTLEKKMRGLKNILYYLGTYLKTIGSYTIRSLRELSLFTLMPNLLLYAPSVTA